MHTSEKDNDEESENVEHGSSGLRGEYFLIDRVEVRYVGSFKAVLEISKSPADAHEEREKTRPGLDIVPLEVRLT